MKKIGIEECKNFRALQLPASVVGHKIEQRLGGINENTKLMGWFCCCHASVVGHKTEQRLGWGRPTKAGELGRIKTQGRAEKVDDLLPLFIRKTKNFWLAHALP